MIMEKIKSKQWKEFGMAMGKLFLTFGLSISFFCWPLLFA